MIDNDVREQLKNLDDRLARVEQFLPSVATKDDLKAFATKDDLQRFVSREEFRATVATLATREEMTTLFAQHSEQIRSHFDVVAESLRDEIRMTQDGHIASTSRLETLERKHDRLDRRVTVLEAGGAKRKK